MSSEEATASELSVDPKRAARMLASGAELIDIRRDYEWEAGRIPDARHVEVNQLTSQADSIPKDRPVIFYCRTGNRSQMAAEAFHQAGYDAHNMAGGITAWTEAGLALEPEGGEVRDPLPAT
jgi:rhodanese-related sulfurtransferase